MNNDRRKAIQAVSEKIEALKGTVDELKSELESLRNDEQDYYDNMPESFQSGDKGTKAEEAVSQLDTAIEGLDEINSQIDTAVEALTEAQQ